jgi:hypothetical protein
MLTRGQATLRAHTIVRQNVCVYCGTVVSPILWSNGNTRHLDHFIPILYIMKIEAYLPTLQIRNYLIPCCPQCNNLANGNVFECFRDKFDFVRSQLHIRHLGNEAVWSLTQNPASERLLPVRIPDAFASLIHPREKRCAGGNLVIPWPERDADGNWDCDRKRTIWLCSPRTHFSEKLKMAS